MNRSMMHWSPDREPDPVPIHGWDPRMDPDLKADVPFRDTDDPEGARAWLDSQLPQVPGEPEQEVERLRSVPFPPENVRPPVGYRMTNDPRVANMGAPVTDDDWTEYRGSWMRDNIAYPTITADQIYRSMERVRLEREELASRTRQVYPAGCFQDPPTTQAVERPDFPRGEMTGIESVTMTVRMNNGWEETYVIDNPADLEFRMIIDQEYVEVGELQRRVIPGIRELRNILVSIGSPRNWRRLQSRRWR